MDAGLVRECVRADDRLVGLHHESGDGGNQPRGADDVFGIDPGHEGQGVVAGAQRHHHLFQRRIAGPLAEPVDGAFDLSRARPDRGQRVGDGESQIVVTVGRKDRLVAVRHALEQHGDQRPELLRHRVADGVGNVDRRRPRLDRGLDTAAQEIMLGARAVLRRPLDVVGMVARVGHAVDDRPVHLFRLHLELEFHVQRAGRNEGVDARPPRRLQRFAGPVDIVPRRACQPAHHGFPDHGRDLADGFEIAIGGDGEPGLDHIHPHLLEQFGDAQLFVEIHGGAGRLLAVAQCGVEDDDTVRFGDGAHDSILLSKVGLQALTKR